MANADTIFNEKDFNEQWITCSNCGWKGTGAHAIIIDMYGIGDSRLVSCPNCDSILGSLPKPSVPKQPPDDLTASIG